MQASSARISWTKFVLGSSICLFLTALPIWIGYGQTCCAPSTLPNESYRFTQGASVTVYIDTSSNGFTGTEASNIEIGIEDWNNQNNSGISYTVVFTDTPPTQGANTPDTIVVSYVDEDNPSAHATNLMLRTDGNTYGQIDFYRSMRLIPPQFRESFWRTVARHETGHTQGLQNGDNCPQGTTIMNHLGAHVETFITPCDNQAVNGQNAYATPTPTPTLEPSPTPCAEEGQTCAFDGDCCPGYACGSITNRCFPCERDNNNPSSGACMSQACYLCYAGEGTYCDPYTGSCYTPLIVDIDGDGFDLTNLNNGVRYDAFGHNTTIQSTWTKANSDDAWLVLDRNGNGRIDNGIEMFSSIAPQPQPPASDLKNGFNALVQFDKSENGGNSDGVLNKHDSIFSSLRLWQDSNQNGVGEPNELHALPDLGLRSIDMDYKKSRKKDKHGNVFRYRAKVKDAQGAQLGRWIYDVFPLARN